MGGFDLALMGMIQLFGVGLLVAAVGFTGLFFEKTCLHLLSPSV